MKKAEVEIWDMHEPYKESDVIISSEIKASKKFPKNILCDIDLAWQFKKGYPNPLVNLVSYENINRQIFMNINLGDFKYHITLNTIDEMPKQLSGKVKSTISDFRKFAVSYDQLPLTAMALLYTKNHIVVFAERSKGGITVGNYSVLPGGYTHPVDDLDTLGNISTNKTIRREFSEEAGVDESFIDTLYNTGNLFSDNKNRGFSLTYLMKVDLTFRELNQTYSEKNDNEFKKLIPVDFSEKSIECFLENHILDLTNNSLGTLLVSAGVYFGDKWFNKTLEYSRSRYGEIAFFPHNYGRINELLKDRAY